MGEYITIAFAAVGFVVSFFAVFFGVAKLVKWVGKVNEAVKCAHVSSYGYRIKEDMQLLRRVCHLECLAAELMSKNK